MNKETLKIQAEDVSKLATDINKKVKEVSGNDETNIETLRELLLQTMEFLSDAHDMRANLSEWIFKTMKTLKTIKTLKFRRSALPCE